MLYRFTDLKIQFTNAAMDEYHIVFLQRGDRRIGLFFFYCLQVFRSRLLCNDTPKLKFKN